MWRLERVIILLALIMCAVPVRAATPYYLSSSELFVKQASTGTYNCGYIASRWLSGSLTGTAFYTNKSKVQDLTKKVRASSGSKREKLQKKLDLLKLKTSRGDKACKDGPASTPTPSGNFDSSGNVTAQGKSVFGIPASLSANVSQGKTANNLMCAGCHGERLNYSFTQLRSVTSASPMFFTSNDLSDATLANITAYLNRYRTN